ncbi:Probable N-acetyltransferase 16 [Vulpes lagopus]
MMLATCNGGVVNRQGPGEKRGNHVWSSGDLSAEDISLGRPRSGSTDRDGKGVARLLQRFRSQLVQPQHPGIKVAQLIRDDQLGLRELEKYRLIPKQRDVLPVGAITQDWPSNLRLLAAEGLEWHVDSRAYPQVLTLCTPRARPLLHPQGGDGTWRYLHIDAFGSDGAQVQSQLSDTCTARPRVSPASTSCARFS